MFVLIKVEKINEFRFRKGWSIRALAQAAKIGEVTAQQICSGKRNPSAPVAKKIVDALDVEFDDIFRIVKEETAENSTIN